MVITATLLLSMSNIINLEIRWNRSRYPYSIKLSRCYSLSKSEPETREVMAYYRERTHLILDKLLEGLHIEVAEYDFKKTIKTVLNVVETCMELTNEHQEELRLLY